MTRRAYAPPSVSRLVLFLAVTVVAAVPAAAQIDGPLAWSGDPEALVGWRQAGEGLWTRTLEDGTVETEALGRAGLIQALDQLDTEMVRLVEVYLRNPSDEMAQALDTHLALIQRIEADLAAGKVRSTPPTAPLGCSTSWYANAGAVSSGCGNFAQASSSYYGDSAGDCFGLCDLYSYAYVERTACDETEYTATQSCNKPGVINDSCSSYVSLSQSPVDVCDADSSASIYCPAISWLRSTSKPSTACGNCSECQCLTTVTADCSGAGGGTRSCTGSCGNSWAVDDCYASCDGFYYNCPSPPGLCPF